MENAAFVINRTDFATKFLVGEEAATVLVIATPTLRHINIYTRQIIASTSTADDEFIYV